MKPIKVYHKDEDSYHHHDHECSPDCNHEHHNHYEEDEDEGEEITVFKEDKVKINIIPEKAANQITFSNFLNFFPKVELPFTISSETQRRISIENEPLSAQWMYHFVLGKEEEIDEFTEFMPCFLLPKTNDFHAIVYWEAGIEGSTYYLTTFSKNGVLIDKVKVAGTKYDQTGLYQMVCAISPSWMFSCAEGRLDEYGNTAPVSSENHHIQTTLQLTGDGEIVPI